MIDLIAAVILIIMFSIMVIFQFLLAIGMPIGFLAYGGQHKKLSRKLRILSVIAMGIFIYAIIVVLDRTGIITLFSNPWVSGISIWILAIYFTIGILMNAVSRSKWEKRIMTPFVLIIAICCYLIAIFS
jgi:hypothetical protein